VGDTATGEQLGITENIVSYQLLAAPPMSGCNIEKPR
jgi:hypothetical protein